MVTSTKVNRDLFYTLASDLESERVQSVIKIIDELKEIKTISEEDYTKELNYTIDRLITGLGSNKGSARLGFSLGLTELINIDIDDGNLDINGYIKKLFEKLPLNNNSNNTGKKIKGKDERGYVFGRLFGLQILLNEPLFSKVFFKTEKSSQSEINSKFLLKYVNLLVELSSFKSWIKESSLFTVYQILTKLKSQISNDKDNILVEILHVLDSNNLTMTMEGLAIYLLFSSQEQNKHMSAFRASKLHWEYNDPLNKSNLSLLVKVLKDVPVNDVEGNEQQQKGYWAPRLHFVFPILIQTLLLNADEESLNGGEEPPLKKSKKNSGNNSNNRKNHNVAKKFTIEDFIKNILDEAYFNEKSSNERKYLGFLIFKLCLESFPTNKLDVLFQQQNFLRTLINQSSNKERMLYKLCNTLLNKQIPSIIESQPEKFCLILKNIWFNKHGSLINFDQLTKSKFTSNLLNHPNLLEQNLFDITNMLIENLEIALNSTINLNIEYCSKGKVGEEDEEYQDKKNKDLKTIKFCIDSLLHLIRSHKSKISESWISPILQILVRLAFFKNKDELSKSESGESSADLDTDMGNQDKEYDISDDQNNIHTIASERLFSIISDLVSATTENKQEQSWPYIVLQKLVQIEGTLDSEYLLNKLDESLNDIKLKSLSELTKMQETLDTTKKASKNISKNVIQGLQLLFTINLLQLYSGNVESIGILEDLSAFYSEYMETCKNSEKSAKTGVFVGITEILMSLISEQKSLMRKLSLNSWELFVKEIGLEELNILLEALDARENKKGFAQLFGGEYDSEDEKDDDDDEDDEDDEDEDDDEEGDEDEEDFEDEDAIEADNKNHSSSKIEKETASALAKALDLPENMIDENGEVNYDGYVDMGSDDDDDDEDEDEEEMDDEKMMELDETLSLIFKNRKDALGATPTGNQRKVEVQKARENVIQFKTRIVDMLEIYVKNIEDELSSADGNNLEYFEQIVSILVPMTKCIKTTLSKPLADKIGKLLKTKVTKVRVKISSSDSDLVETSLTTLKTIHNLALSSKVGQFPQLFYSTCSIVSLFVSKIIGLASEDKKLDAVMDVYNNTMKLWTNSSQSKTPQFFFADYINMLSTRKQQHNQ